MNALTFRLTAIVAFLLPIGAPLIDLIFPELVSSEIGQALESGPSPFLLEYWPSIAFLCAFLVSSIAGFVGLLLFRNWGRALSLWTTLIGLCIYPFLGSYVTSSAASTLSELGATLWGAVLALAYFSSLAAHFEGRRIG